MSEESLVILAGLLTSLARQSLSHSRACSFVSLAELRPYYRAEPQAEPRRELNRNIPASHILLHKGYGVISPSPWIHSGSSIDKRISHPRLCLKALSDSYSRRLTKLLNISNCRTVRIGCGIVKELDCALMFGPFVTIATSANKDAETEALRVLAITITSKASKNVVSGLGRECCLVKERQRVVALHLYYRRAQEQEESDRKPDGRHALRDRSGEDLSGEEVAQEGLHLKSSQLGSQQDNVPVATWTHEPQHTGSALSEWRDHDTLCYLTDRQKVCDILCYLTDRQKVWDICDQTNQRSGILWDICDQMNQRSACCNDSQATEHLAAS
uniref:Uncharacterized protein n=1 Tax=Timema genevievae TaxID=629358 RepID=A0A7R9PNF3_TIMGE|nr:unnamed protein product [Timema genevievae]